MSNEGKCGIIKVVVLPHTEAMVQDYDIILCAGRSRMSKRIVRYQRLFCDVSEEAARISHVAIVKRNWRSVGQPDNLYRQNCKVRDGYAEIFESTTLNKWAGKSGVQRNSLRMWMENYDGDVYILPLVFDRTELHYKKMDMFVRDNLGLPYENGILGPLELALCGIPWIDNKPTKEPHCTENNVKCLQYGKLFNPDAKPNKFPPCQFWPGGTFVKNLADDVEALEPLLIVR